MPEFASWGDAKKNPPKKSKKKKKIQKTIPLNNPPSQNWGGGLSGPGDVWYGGCLLLGVSGPRGVSGPGCLVQGVSAPGGCGIPACTETETPHEQNDRQV